ncbi:hypothetical protein LMG22037_06327 [Paraburkholderia phenoliruptrix]|uniref:Uncharacterized protein n=1 Tax=Paraburkholderia phenoliruptrix TaxID=252970 RepID=A0A6J5CKN4_9BURK|nr:hypothetical protein LMG22037_06327 [Paraburkholderia phenoliruptrix]
MGLRRRLGSLDDDGRAPHRLLALSLSGLRRLQVFYDRLQNLLRMIP